MITVYKYPLAVDAIVTLDMPTGAEVLIVAVQHGAAMLWARVDTDQPHETRRFRVAGTGHPRADGRYIGTLIMHGDHLVFHVFDLAGCDR